ncbi:hypothetical protein [Streptomyces rubradiris]|uniref:hypothetical protein n=1 Tax=Streptomyces rubradiris TaxID=285531 RepID=UPI001676871C|nr:hypothetical protein [Streptomyces rubradiris]GHH31657.1 hypothetical protein GCM10018792_79460 [Streptomyces rubradiris]
MTIKTNSRRSHSAVKPFRMRVTAFGHAVPTYGLAVHSIERHEELHSDGVRVGLYAEVTLTDRPGRSVVLTVSRLAGEKSWFIDSKIEFGGRVHYSRDFGHRGPLARQLMSGVGDVLDLTAHRYQLATGSPQGSPLVLSGVKRRKAKKATAQA